jgi:hypothetical protein
MRDKRPFQAKRMTELRELAPLVKRVMELVHHYFVNWPSFFRAPCLANPINLYEVGQYDEAQGFGLRYSSSLFGALK